MKLSIGIVGLPNVGKSTLFNALTRNAVPAENYPFCTIDPSVGIVPVPDERLYALAEFSKSEKTIPTVVEFVDIAGLVAGAHKGEGLGNQFLAHIREVDAIAHVVRIFEDSNITHVHGKIDPLNDIEVINAELILADLATVEKRKTAIERDAKRGDPESKEEYAVLSEVSKLLDSGSYISSRTWSKEEAEFIKPLHLLTEKKILYVLNRKTGEKEIDTDQFKKLTDWVINSGARYVILDAKTEEELKDFEGEEKKTFKRDMGIDDEGIENLIREGYTLLDLITFFTTGEKETRGWTIERNSTAPVAGGAIHSDFRDKFIRAEIVFWKDLIDAGSRAKAREKGLIRTEGKEYVVKDGDVIEFKI